MPRRQPTYLLVGENWYPDWHATVDGKPAPVLPGATTRCSAWSLPPGAREVTLQFASAAYARGKLVTLLALLVTLALLARRLVAPPAERGPWLSGPSW